MTLVPGTTLGRYQILEPLGQGGMATVYKAYQPALERTVALKVIRRGFAEDAEFRERFAREARAIARLTHPHIVQVFDYDESDGQLFLPMHYLESGTLKARLAALAERGRRSHRPRPVPFSEAGRDHRAGRAAMTVDTTRFCGSCGAARESMALRFCRQCGAAFCGAIAPAGMTVAALGDARRRPRGLVALLERGHALEYVFILLFALAFAAQMFAALVARPFQREVMAMNEHLRRPSSAPYDARRVRKVMLGAALSIVLSCGSAAEQTTPVTTPTDVPRSAFPTGAEGTMAWARACLPDASMSILLMPDLPYISSPRPSFWWDTASTEKTDLRLADGGSATEMRAKDANDMRVVALFTLRAQRWAVEGRKGDAKFRPAVECVHRRLATL